MMLFASILHDEAPLRERCAIDPTMPVRFAFNPRLLQQDDWREVEWNVEVREEDAFISQNDGHPCQIKTAVMLEFTLRECAEVLPAAFKKYVADEPLS